jgi:hypothetical protein
VVSVAILGSRQLCCQGELQGIQEDYRRDAKAIVFIEENGILADRCNAWM